MTFDRMPVCKGYLLTPPNLGGGFSGDMTTGQWADARGYDLMLGESEPGEDLFNPCCNDTHGTSVAGIMLASQSNGIGGAGIAPNVRMGAVRIFRQTYPPELIEDGIQVATQNQIADGINYAWQSMGASVINNSWRAGAPSNAITTAINNALTQGRGGLGTVVVFSAGNTSDRALGVIGQVTYPATLSATTNVISVGAINKSGQPANYTPNGPIDVVAPSGHLTDACVGEVVTIDRYGAPGCNDGPNDDDNATRTFSGTSASAPQVAAVAALLLSRSPGLTAAQVKARLRNTADPWGCDHVRNRQAQCVSRAHQHDSALGRDRGPVHGASGHAAELECSSIRRSDTLQLRLASQWRSGRYRLVLFDGCRQRELHALACSNRCRTDLPAVGVVRQRNELPAAGDHL